MMAARMEEIDFKCNISSEELFLSQHSTLFQEPDREAINMSHKLGKIAGIQRKDVWQNYGARRGVMTQLSKSQKTDWIIVDDVNKLCFQIQQGN